jgi:hypothetical protein
MLWTLKILLFTNFLFIQESPKNIHTYHYQICHYDWAENFTYQLELKEDQTFYFTRQVFNSKLQKNHVDFVTGSFNVTNDTLILNPSITSSKLVQERGSLSYLLKNNRLSLIDNLTHTILPGQFEKPGKAMAE